MRLIDILKRKKEIIEKAKQLGFFDNVKFYLGPKPILYVVVDFDRKNKEIVDDLAGRSLGLTCEITDLLNCQVGVINTAEISQIGEYDVSIKSALLTDDKRLKRIFGDLD